MGTVGRTGRIGRAAGVRVSEGDAVVRAAKEEASRRKAAMKVKGPMEEGWRTERRFSRLTLAAERMGGGLAERGALPERRGGEEDWNVKTRISREGNIRILIADEPADWVKTFVEDLHSAAVDMFLAEDERQGLEIVRREHVDLAVIAGDNPRIGGLELVRRVHWYSSEVPVIVLGGEMNVRWLQEALRVGVRTILPRPVNVNRLVRVSVKILGV